MNLFIETPQRAAERLERERRYARAAAPALDIARVQDGAASTMAASLDLDEPDSVARHRPGNRPYAAQPRAGQPYSVAQDSYQRELAFDKQRARRRKVTGMLKMALFVLLLPVALVVVFIAAYALACIANGASPQELLGLLGALLERMGGFVAGALAAS